MSDEARAWAKRQAGVRIAAKSVLNALAGYADADGIAWPKVSTLADVTGMTERHVRRQLKTLEDATLIAREERFRPGAGGNSSNYYKLAMPRSELIGDRPDTYVSPRPDTCVRPSLTQVSSPPGQSGQAVRTSVENKGSEEPLARADERLMRAAASDGFARELQVISTELIRTIAQECEGQPQALRSHLPNCLWDPASTTLHPYSWLGKGEIDRDLHKELHALGLTLGDPIGGPRPVRAGGGG